MFEAVLALCLAASPETCRDALLPGYEAMERAICEARLAANPPDRPAGASAAARPRCVRAGPALSLDEIAPGVFVHVGQIAEPSAANGADISNIGVVIGTEAIAVIDAGGAAWIAEALWRAIRKRSALPLHYVILTHMHPDHVMGADVLRRAGAGIVGHARLSRALADRRANYFESLSALIGARQLLGSGDGIGANGPEIPIEAGETVRLALGGRTLGVRAWPNAHTGTDVSVHLEEEGLFFAGDLLFETHVPALDGSLTGWQRTLEALGAPPDTPPALPERAVPGHGPAVLPWPEGGEALVRYLDVLASDTRKALAEGQSLGAAVPGIAVSQAPFWELFDAYNPRNATVAYTELEWE
ncbi:quinoprotein relay system zinc metallohydrolase 2 [Profundibacterium mesophilum]|uniref:Beta-lactamase n=1 Tax=Profundibacterium mesophilum KAUST100406-0324 TaxID=1037889 RepID=A0A921NNA5_9RHOB|nr:quinoprotein relay system zinc metallohydrolase 2 [Profundibacterium mesophilum]KAF0674706.1 beta-lactamase [Profundibacterium mesophilum KAUST100406-0324]